MTVYETIPLTPLVTIDSHRYFYRGYPIFTSHLLYNPKNKTQTCVAMRDGGTTHFSYFCTCKHHSAQDLAKKFDQLFTELTLRVVTGKVVYDPMYILTPGAAFLFTSVTDLMQSKHLINYIP